MTSENIAEMVLEVTRFEPMALLEVGGGLASFVEELLTFSVVFLRSASGANTALLSSYVAGDADSATVDAERQSRSAFIRNPYLVSKFVEVIFAYTWDYGRGSTLDDTMKNVFGTHPVAKKYLVASLIAFYVDVEKTGLSSQFYEKFSMYGGRRVWRSTLMLIPHSFPTVATTFRKSSNSSGIAFQPSTNQK